MAIRDHFRLDLLVRQAARLQELDAQLGAVERLTRIDQGGAAGACPNCDALYPRGAVYCSQCAHPLMRMTPGS
jgi:predicted amidophosphoribosyltransferase